MKILHLTYRNNILISAPKIDTDLLWDLSLLFIVFVVIYFVGVFFYKNRISGTSKKVRDRKRELSPMISEFLFLEEDATKDEKSNYIALKIEIRQLLKDTFNRRVLSEILLDLRKDLSGDAQQSLFQLYQDLGLHKDAFAKLKSWRWQVISKGILELTQMEVVGSYSFITKFINDKRAIVRKQAEIATVTLRHEGIDHFLDTTKYKISEWQQLKMLDVIRNQEDFQPPRFKAWLTSNNKYVVLFALRLIKYYNQNDANASLIELIKHKNSQIKEEAIACIKEFNVTQSLKTLKLVFWNCSTDVKIAILGAIAEIGSATDIEFLHQINRKEFNFSVKGKALSAINAISPESIMPSKGIQDESRYRIPHDITEEVSKIHAEKHAEITGEKDEEFIDSEILEDTIRPQEIDTTLQTEKEQNELYKTEIEAEADFMDKEIGSPLLEITERPSSMEEPKDINEIVVEAEQIMAMKEGKQANEPDDTEWRLNHLNFLPFIVDKEKSKIEQEELQSSSSSAEAPFNIQVVYEEIIANEQLKPIENNDQPKEKLSILEDFNIEELRFLPIVINTKSDTVAAQTDKLEEKEEELQERLVEYDGNTDYKFYETEAIRNAKVIYEEVSSKELEEELRDIEVTQPYVFSVENILDQALASNFQDEEEDEIELPIENEQLLQKIIDNLMASDSAPQKEDIQIDDSYINNDWDLDENELDFTPVFFEKAENPSPSYIQIEKNMNDGDINIPKVSIPKAIFGDIEFEANTRQLLNDLEEMGDDREIPFLKELLSHEKYNLFKERINALIDMINHNEEKDKIENALQPFSVFQDLFRTCDTEAKLILLNEVVAVGDEKELHFLESLATEDSSKIRKKAQEVLQELKIKLGQGEEDAQPSGSVVNEVVASDDFSKEVEESSLHSSNNPEDIFDLNFDFAANFDENDDVIKKKDQERSSLYGSFFGQIYSFSHKIVEKLYG